MLGILEKYNNVHAVRWCTLCGNSNTILEMNTRITLFSMITQWFKGRCCESGINVGLFEYTRLRYNCKKYHLTPAQEILLIVHLNHIKPQLASILKKSDIPGFETL